MVSITHKWTKHDKCDDCMRRFPINVPMVRHHAVIDAGYEWEESDTHYECIICHVQGMIIAYRVRIRKFISRLILTVRWVFVRYDDVKPTIMNRIKTIGLMWHMMKEDD
jgi:hypothetical protein